MNNAIVTCRNKGNVIAGSGALSSSWQVRQVTHHISALLHLRVALNNQLHGLTTETEGSDWSVEERLTVRVLQVS